MTRVTELVMLYGAMPMFIRRAMVCGASLVCRVDSTMWPVCAALIADLGGFQVADFADHDHVRVLAQEAAQRGGEGHAALDVHAAPG